MNKFRKIGGIVAVLSDARQSVLAFLGGSVSAMALRDFGIPYFFAMLETLTKTNPDWTMFAFDCSLEILLLLLPVILAIVFALRVEKERVVPPLYINLVSLGFFIFGIYPPNNFINFLSLYFVGAFLFLSGIALDSRAVAIVGMYSPRNQFLRYCLTVHAPADEVIELLKTTKIRDALSLRSNTWLTSRGTLFRTYGKLRSQLAIEVVPIGSDALLRFVHFGRRSYEILSDESIQEDANMDVAYIKNVLTHRKTHWFDTNPELAEPLVSDLLDGLQGFMKNVREVPTMKLLSLVLSVLLVMIGVGLAISQHYDLAIGTFAIAVYAVYETVTLLRET